VAVQMKGHQILLLQNFMFSVAILPAFRLKSAQEKENHPVLDEYH
jgi:hypothetical protein